MTHKRENILAKVIMERRPVLGAYYEKEECFFDENGGHPLLTKKNDGYFALFFEIFGDPGYFIGLMCEKCAEEFKDSNTRADELRI